MTAPLVEVDNVTLAYDLSKSWLERKIEKLPRQILVAAANVSFTIDRRETFGLVGESGSGKSTIARIVVGLLQTLAGNITIDGVKMTGRDSAGRQKLRRRIQMIFQDPYASLDPRWRAFDIIAEPIRAFDLIEGRSKIAARVGMRVGASRFSKRGSTRPKPLASNTNCASTSYALSASSITSSRRSWVTTSRPVVGSSSTISGGRQTSAIAMLTRCCWPPLS